MNRDINMQQIEKVTHPTWEFGRIKSNSNSRYLPKTKQNKKKIANVYFTYEKLFHTRNNQQQLSFDLMKNHTPFDRSIEQAGD